MADDEEVYGDEMVEDQLEEEGKGEGEVADDDVRPLPPPTPYARPVCTELRSRPRCPRSSWTRLLKQG